MFCLGCCFWIGLLVAPCPFPLLSFSYSLCVSVCVCARLHLFLWWLVILGFGANFCSLPLSHTVKPLWLSACWLTNLQPVLALGCHGENCQHIIAKRLPVLEGDNFCWQYSTDLKDIKKVSSSYSYLYLIMPFKLDSWRLPAFCFTPLS